MVLFVHGFPNKYTALQFEWAWQFPHLSRHFKSAYPGAYTGTRSERLLPAKLRVLSDMFHLNQWSRWPLRIHFLNTTIATQFGALPTAPLKHVTLKSGPMESIQHEFADESSEDHAVRLHDHISKMQLMASETDCVVCMDPVDIEQPNMWLTCERELCPMLAHLICLSEWFLQEERTDGKAMELLPVAGSCPLCREELRWGDLIRSMNSRIRSFEIIGGKSAAVASVDSDDENSDGEERGREGSIPPISTQEVSNKLRNCMTRDFVREATRGAFGLSQQPAFSSGGPSDPSRMARLLQAAAAAAATTKAGLVGDPSSQVEGAIKKRGRQRKGNGDREGVVPPQEDTSLSQLPPLLPTKPLSPSKRKRKGATLKPIDSNPNNPPSNEAMAPPSTNPPKSKPTPQPKPFITGDVRELYIPMFSDPLLDISEDEEDEEFNRLMMKAKRGTAVTYKSGRGGESNSTDWLGTHPGVVGTVKEGVHELRIG
ncbi:Structure-specific endonuclease subunit SLX1 [Rhizophlyctis rosea]|uniref:Structure-specific endonuclease subunit SLX1 n=1 Tax=Rhizophlyctis rosea TaxID=64517 RepID=A0AAD5SBJ7_9FUNG|nr:Structure-specific endonuclease subunit SLX1 [Rhizophlyctis rosea]